MQVTIVGLPGSGKTTVFNALTGAHAETGGFSGGRACPTSAWSRCPTSESTVCPRSSTPKKTTYADVTYVDVAIPAGAAREGTINPDVLAQIRNADALLHVARAFDDPAPTPADPWRDVDELDLEFTVADLVGHREATREARTQGRHGSQAEREQAQREEELLRAHRAAPLRGQAAPRLRADRRRGAAPPRLPVPHAEAGARGAEHRRGPPAGCAALETAGRERYDQPESDVAALAGKIEAEIGELAEDDARLFMDDLGIAEPSRGRVIRLTYELLGLFSFFTAGEDECRAWTLRRGCDRPSTPRARSTPTSRAASSAPR
jgi:ribosome-binding ATPase